MGEQTLSYDYDFRMTQCQTCGRKILVEILRFGVNHDADIIASCAECLIKRLRTKEFKRFRKEHSDAAKVILEWAKQ